MFKNNSFFFNYLNIIIIIYFTAAMSIPANLLFFRWNFKITESVLVVYSNYNKKKKHLNEEKLIKN